MARDEYLLPTLILPTSAPDDGALVCLEVTNDWSIILLDLLALLENNQIWAEGTDLDLAYVYTQQLQEIVVKAKQDGCVVIPIGATMTWHMSLPPAKWLVCNGQSVAKATYPELYALWGDKYGSTSTHFNVVNMVDVSPFGSGGLFPVVDGAGGAFNTTLTIAQIPSHNHGIRIVTGGAAGANNALVVTQANVTTAPTIHASNFNGNGDPHSNLHPVLAVKFIVYAGH